MEGSAKNLSIGLRNFMGSSTDGPPTGVWTFVLEDLEAPEVAGNRGAVLDSCGMITVGHLNQFGLSA